jgi:hypothetical protein
MLLSKKSLSIKTHRIMKNDNQHDDILYNDFQHYDT